MRAGVAKYATLSAAVAAGYVPATNPRGYVVHYANWSVVATGDVLDPNRPSSLVYANTRSGPLLIGVMFLGPGPCQPGPDAAGSLTQWHAHADLCLSQTHEVVGKIRSQRRVCGRHAQHQHVLHDACLDRAVARYELPVRRASAEGCLRRDHPQREAVIRLATTGQISLFFLCLWVVFG